MEIIFDKKNIEDVYPMSDIARGMIFHSLRDSDVFAFHGQQVFQLKDKDFSIEIFKKAFALLVKKHPILRTGFKMFGFDEPVQVVYKQVPLNIRHYNISHSSLREQEEYIRFTLEEDKQKPFNMTTAEPLWRIKIFSLDRERIIFIWISHHAMIDGWSTAYLLTELNNTYMMLKTRPDFVPGELKSTYKDFVIQEIKEKRKSRNVEFWKKELAGYKRFEFPDADQGGGKRKEENHARSLGAGMLSLLNQRAKAYNTSVKHLCFSAFVYMLNMVSYETDIVVGLVTNTRPLCEDGDKVIGCFLNGVPVRIKIPAHMTWLAYIGMIEEKLMELKAYERLSLFEIASIIGEEAREQNPVFDLIFNFVDFHIYGQLNRDHIGEIDEDSEDESLSLEGAARINTSFNFNVDATLGELSVFISYYDSVVSKEMVVKLCDYFEAILNKIIYNPGSLVEKEEVLSPEEMRRLLLEFNKPGMEVPDFLQYKTIPQLFAEQAARTPDGVAVVGSWHRSLAVGKEERNGETVQITYRELNEKSNRLAYYLRRKGAGPDTIVGIMSERSLEMIIGLMGILKAGGAYLPLDPEWPEKRKKYMLADSGAKVLVTARTLAEEVEKLKSWEVEKIYSTSQPTHLCYIIYTSGTTGKPRAIMVEHRQVTHFIYGIHQGIYRRYKHGLRVALVSPYVFDGSVKQIFAALLYGHSLYIVPESTRRNGAALLEFYERYAVEISDGTPAHILLMQESGGERMLNLGMKNFIIAGEVLPKKLVEDFLNRFKSKTPVITNAYGPSECCGDSTMYHITPINRKKVHLYKSVPIGIPMPGEQIYILDKNMRLMPVGVSGELCIGGSGVTRGYLNQPELTVEKFSYRSYRSYRTYFSKRIYKTGDLARWLPDGNIEFCGRIDLQVKIRGFRIEPEEIESQLENYEAIRAAVVTGREDSSGGDRFLCAYLVLEKGAELSVSKLKEYLSRQLTDYMIPSHFVIMDSFPLTHIGKVDRGALPAPAGIALASHNKYAPPRNALEEKLIRIWADILKIDANKIGVYDNFFELGGNSINILETANQIRCKIDMDIAISVLFLHPTIADIAAIIHEQEHLNKLECIVKLNNGHNEKNIFIIHPFHGLIYPYRELARLLENDYNVYGIQARGLVKDSKLPETSAAMVADYIYQIREIQKQGPYVIAGFCFGSVVAYEIVKQLEDTNGTVEKLIFLDEHAFIPDQTFRYFEHRERRKNHTLFKPFNNLLALLKKTRDKDNSTGDPGVFPGDPEKRKERVDANNRRLDEGFVLGGIINSPLLVIKAEANDNPRFGMKYMARMSGGEVTIVEVAGQHNTILTQPYVKRVAEIIKNM